MLSQAGLCKLLIKKKRKKEKLLKMIAVLDDVKKGIVKFG